MLEGEENDAACSGGSLGLWRAVLTNIQGHLGPKGLGTLEWPSPTKIPFSGAGEPKAEIQATTAVATAC